MPRLDPSEYPPAYEPYVSLVPDADLLDAIRPDRAETFGLAAGLTEAEALAKHPPSTWSVKDVIGHLVDTERVFGYRALRFARGDATPLPGFDQDDYARTAGADARRLADLLDEFRAVRRGHHAFFAGLSEADWSRRGVANGAEISVRALAASVVGHERHHAAILRRRLAPPV